jgi:predicted Holliday junction resolvase-like endonuclease
VEAGRGEENTREDAVKRGEAVIKSKVTEHLIPSLPEFRYNLQDAKFIGFLGSPVVFDGLSEGQLRKSYSLE